MENLSSESEKAEGSNIEAKQMESSCWQNKWKQAFS